jgi:hypothetical protein
MTATGLSFVLAVLWVLGCVGASAQERASDDDYIRCKLTYGLFACDAYVRQDGAVLFAEANTSSPILRRKIFGQVLGMYEPASKSDNVKWIPVYIVVDGPDGPRTKAITTYVRRSEVILDTDFRRVVGCWPAKYVKDPDGGDDYYPGETYFTTKGIASYPHHPVTVREYGEQHTYYAEGIFTVRHEKYSNRGYLGHATLDYASHTVKFVGTTPLKEPEQVQWFSSDDLKGCKDFPTIDPNSHAPNPKALKE